MRICGPVAMLVTLVASFVALGNRPCMSDEDEGFTLVLKTQTSNLNNAGTDEHVYFAVHYTEAVEVPQKGGTKPKKKIVKKRLQATLDNPGNDRKVGALETYRLKFNCPVDTIRHVEIGMVNGDDAWHLSGFEYYVEREGAKSRPTTIVVNRWISAAANDGSRRSPAQQYFIFDVKPPTFPPVK